MRIDDAEFSKWLEAHDYPSKRITYRVDEANREFVIFGATGRTGRVMLPSRLIKEWIEAYESGRIKSNFSSRKMRETVREKSEWANQLHSFDTHLAAVVHRWSTHGLRVR